MQFGGKKRVTTIIAIIIIAALVFVFQFIILRPQIEYSIGTSTSFYPNQTNSINIQCVNRGGAASSFYLVLNATNATFPTHSTDSYQKVSDTIVRIPFTLQGNIMIADGDSKPVLFTIDSDVEEFSFFLSLETTNPRPMNSLGTLYSTGYKWNQTDNNYQLHSLSTSVP